MRTITTCIGVILSIKLMWENEFMAMNIKRLIVGDQGKVIGFNKTAKAYRKRLLAMGLTPGIEFKVTRYAPLGDPVEIKLRGFSLALRKNEAEVLLVEKI